MLGSLPQYLFCHFAVLQVILPWRATHGYLFKILVTAKWSRVGFKAEEIIYLDQHFYPHQQRRSTCVIIYIM